MSCSCCDKKWVVCPHLTEGSDVAPASFRPLDSHFVGGEALCAQCFEAVMSQGSELTSESLGLRLECGLSLLRRYGMAMDPLESLKSVEQMLFGDSEIENTETAC